MTRRLSALAFGLVLSLAVLEVALRVAPGALIPQKLLRRFQADVRSAIAQEIGLANASQMWTLARDDGGPELLLRKPGSEIVWDFHDGHARQAIRMDENGFCNAPSDRYDRDPIELVVLGDSFTECVVTDPARTWPSRLGALTGRSVYNLGKGGIGPYEYLQIFERFGVPKHPSVVVMSVYEGNDLRDAVLYHDYVEARRRGEQPTTELAGDRNTDPIDYQAALDHPLGRHSRAVDLLVVGAGQLFESVHNQWLRATGGKAPERVDFRYTLALPGRDVPFNVQNADESEVRFARMLHEGTVSLDAFDAALERLAALAREHGFRAIVSYAPSANTAYGAYVRYDDPALAELMPWFSAEQRRHLAARCEALGLEFVDLTPAFEAAVRERDADHLLYHPVNVHYTPDGHEVAAQALAQVVGRPAAAPLNAQAAPTPPPTTSGTSAGSRAAHRD